MQPSLTWLGATRLMDEETPDGCCRWNTGGGHGVHICSVVVKLQRDLEPWKLANAGDRSEFAKMDLGRPSILSSQFAPSGR
jgi:hypothetical protein